MKQFNLIFILLSLIFNSVACAKDNHSIIADSLEELSKKERVDEIDFQKIVNKQFDCLFFIDKNANDSLFRHFEATNDNYSKPELKGNEIYTILLKKDNKIIYSESIKNPAIIVPFTYRNKKYCIDEFKFGVWTDKAKIKKFILPIKKSN